MTFIGDEPKLPEYELRRIVDNKNREMAKQGLSDVTTAIGMIQEDNEKLKRQLTNIPIHNDQKDQLGENVETYITEITSFIESDVIGKLQSVLNDEDNINKKAEEKDIKEARYEKVPKRDVVREYER